MPVIHFNLVTKEPKRREYEHHKKQIKGDSQNKKLDPIEGINPQSWDLYEEL